MCLRLLTQIKSRYFALLKAKSNIWMQLARKFSRYMGMGQSQSYSEPIEITQVMKTSKTLMGEILLEKLLPKLMKVVLEFTTSTKGFLLLKEEENFTIQVIYNCNSTPEISLESLSLDTNNLLPKSVINHVAKSKNFIVLNSAINKNKFINDPYIKQNQPKSILCLPLFGKFQLIGIIYLENNLLENAFKPNQVRILQLISPAAGLCIENAQLYEQLEEYSRSLELKVEERTQKLQQSEERFRSLVENAGESFFVFDREGCIVDINQYACNSLGYSREEMLDLCLTDIKIKDEIQASSQKQPSFVFGQPITVETIYRRKDGSTFPAEARISSFEAQGHYVELALVRDITERKQAEAALQKLYQELEVRVQERTAELAQANESLQTEVIERQRAEQVSRGQTAVLTSTLNALTKEAELDKFLQTMLASITKQLSASSSVIWLYDSEQDIIYNYMCYPEEENPQKQESSKISLSNQSYTPASEHPFWQTLNSTKDYIYVNLEQEEILPTQYHQWLVERHVKSLLILPLLINNKLFGLLSIRCRATENFPSEQLELAVALAKQATLAMQLTDLANQSRSTAILEERNRLAREIHDTLAQTFTGIPLQVGVAQRIVNQEPAEAWSLMERVGELAREGLTEARRSVWALFPETLEYNDLPEAISRSVEQITVGTSVQTQVIIQGTPRYLPPETSLNLLRIAQEALTNALKHAQAQFILVELSFTPTSVKLRIRDDGWGFDPQDQTYGGGFGLIGMGQRAEKLGGQLQVFSEPGQGTEITVEIFTLNTGRREQGTGNS